MTTVPREVRLASTDGSRGGRAAVVRAAALELFAARGYLATTMDAIGRAAGIKGPSVYKHYRSKQELLHVIMRDTMEALLADHRLAIANCHSTVEQYRRAVECHARFHARHRLEAFVGNREIGSLDDPLRAEILAYRRTYERSLRQIITDGTQEGVFFTSSPRLTSYAILDMGIGIASWFRPDGEYSENEIAYAYGDFALRLVGMVAPASADATPY